jgi:hypothetical protein
MTDYSPDAGAPEHLQGPVRDVEVASIFVADTRSMPNSGRSAAALICGASDGCEPWGRQRGPA